MMKRLFSLAAAFVVAGSLGASAQTATPKFQWNGNDLEVQKGATFYKLGKYGSSAFSTAVPLYDRNATSPVIDVYTSNPTNFIGLSAGGAIFSKSDVTGAVAGDHDRAALFSKMTTSASANGGFAETNLVLNTVSNSGSTVVWATGTNYTAGTYARVTASAKVYIQTVASCTSAGAGSGPSGTGTGIVDGTCLWDYKNDNALNYTAGIYNGMTVYPGARPTWGAAFNTVRMAGADKAFSANIEFDYSGDSTDCTIGNTNCYNIFMGMNGGPGTAWIGMSGQPVTAPYSAHYGIHASGAHLADLAVFNEDTSAAVGYLAGSLGFAIHSRAGFEDRSGSGTPTGFLGSGTYSNSDFRSNGTSPIGFNATGTNATSAFGSSATTPIGFNGTGTYSSAVFTANPTSSVVDYNCLGSPSFACISINAASPAGIAITGNSLTKGITFTGTRTGPDIDNASTVAIGADYHGTYSTAAIRLSAILLNPTTVGAMTCDATHDGVVRYVTDSSTATFGAVAAGAGANKGMVLCVNGTGWTFR